MELFSKFKELLLGTTDSYSQDDYEEYPESEYYDYDEPPVRRYERDQRRETPREVTREHSEIDYNLGKRKSSSSKNNILEFSKANVEKKSSIVYTYPKNVEDATVICDYVKNNRACVVILEDVEPQKAQRIADFIGGSNYSLNGTIERINNVTFMVTPESFEISVDSKEKSASSGFGFLKAASFR